MAADAHKSHDTKPGAGFPTLLRQPSKPVLEALVGSIFRTNVEHETETTIEHEEITETIVVVPEADSSPENNAHPPRFAANQQRWPILIIQQFAAPVALGVVLAYIWASETHQKQLERYFDYAFRILVVVVLIILLRRT